MNNKWERKWRKAKVIDIPRDSRSLSSGLWNRLPKTRLEYHVFWNENNSKFSNNSNYWTNKFILTINRSFNRCQGFFFRFRHEKSHGEGNESIDSTACTTGKQSGRQSKRDLTAFGSLVAKRWKGKKGIFQTVCSGQPLNAIFLTFSRGLCKVIGIQRCR